MGSVPVLQVEKELSDICSSILSLLDDHLIPTASSGESKVFYLKVGTWPSSLASCYNMGVDMRLAYRSHRQWERLALPQ